MILSIDVGLKNLSYCVVNCSDKRDISTYSIYLWEVVNILNNEEEDNKCESVQKNGNICNKKGSYKYIESDNTIYCCKMHFPKRIKIKKNNNIKKKKVKEYGLQEITKTIISKIQKIYNDNIIIFKEISDIIIELQPTCNQRMKFISHIIYGKYTELYINKEIKINFIRASSKLKMYSGPYIECKLKSKYAQRKWLSIEYCKWYLENKFNDEQRDKWLLFFKSCKKKDDLSDCFLYCINKLIK